MEQFEALLPTGWKIEDWPNGRGHNADCEKQGL